MFDVKYLAQAKDISQGFPHLVILKKKWHCQNKKVP